MIYSAQMPQHKGDSDTRVAILGAMVLCLFGVWRLIWSLRKGPATPEPWDDQVAAEIEGEEATPLCHRCLAQHSPEADFCPECGTAVGKYTNWLPYPYLFSVGDWLRIGAFGNFKRSVLTVAGFLAFGLVEYAIFAPIYWIRVLWNTLENPPPVISSDQATNETDIS